MNADGTLRSLGAGSRPIGRDWGYTYFEETAHLRPRRQANRL